MFGRHTSADVSARNIESRGPEGSAFDIAADGKSRTRCPAAARRTQYLQRAGRGRRESCSTAYRWRPQRIRWLRYQLVTSAEKSSTSAARPSSTIATIRIRRLSTAWCDRWRRCRRSAESWSPAKCWSWVRRAKQMHRDCGRHMAEAGIDFVLGVRGLAQAIVDGAKEVGVNGRVCKYAGRSRRVAASAKSNRATWCC